MWDLPSLDEKTDEWMALNEFAKRICRSCAVQVECGTEAVRRREVGVIRAGMRMPSDTNKWDRYVLIRSAS